MNTKQILPSSATTPADPLLKSRRRYFPNLASWVVGIIVLLLLVGVAVPNYGHSCIRGPQTKALAQAKQIGLALRLFASDNGGEYPHAGLAGMPAAKVNDANAAFAMLFPTYLTNETIFGNKLSAYQTRQADNVYDDPYTGKPVRTLEPGENVYAYVSGLVDGVDLSAPLVVDGTDGTGHYTTDPKKHGGVWEGKKAVVIRLDNSGSLETLVGPDHARYVPRPGNDKSNLLDVSDLGRGVRLLDPASAARDKP